MFLICKPHSAAQQLKICAAWKRRLKLLSLASRTIKNRPASTFPASLLATGPRPPCPQASKSSRGQSQNLQDKLTTSRGPPRHCIYFKCSLVLSEHPVPGVQEGTLGPVGGELAVGRESGWLTRAQQPRRPGQDHFSNPPHPHPWLAQVGTSVSLCSHLISWFNLSSK